MAFLRLGGNVTDDTGKPVKLLDPAGMSEWPTKGDARIDALVIRVRKAMSGWSFYEWSLSLALVFGVFAFYFAARPLINRAIPTLPSFVFFVALAFSAQIFARFLWRARLHSNRRHVVQLVLGEGLCPCCGYNFASLNIDEKQPDELVTCPECGSAWRRNRIDRAAMFDGSLPVSSPVRRFTKREKTNNWMVNDDRGVRVKLVHPRLYGCRPKLGGPTRAERLRCARKEIAPSRLWLRAPIAGLLMAGGAFLVVLAIENDAYAILIAAGVLAVLSLGCWHGNFLYSPRVVRRTMLGQDLCPSCSNDLSGRPVSARDGCVLCPGCSAAWRVAPPTEST
jgi:hypothetical protein